MYVNVTEKQAEELVELGRKSGWKLVNRKPKKIRCLFVANGQIWRYSLKANSSKPIKQVRTILSYKYAYINGRKVYKTKRGLQIGCTFIPNKVAKQIVNKVFPQTIFVKDKEVKFENERVILGYNSWHNEDVRKLAEFAGFLPKGVN